MIQIGREILLSFYCVHSGESSLGFLEAVDVNWTSLLYKL